MTSGSRRLSFWHDTAGDDFDPRPALDGDRDVDVAIVGGGLTGLWTARSLAEADPSLRILVVESEVCGFGASGRNGGWCSALLPMAAPDMAAAMRATVDEVGRAAADDGIDCHYAKGGTLTLVTNPAQERRVRAEADHEGYEWLDRDAAIGALRGAGCARRRVHAGLRGHPPRSTGPRAGGRGREPWRPGRRGHARAADPPRCGGDRPRARPRRGGAAVHRGLHAAHPGSPTSPDPHLLVDDRDRAARRRLVGRGRACATARRSPTGVRSSSTASAPPTDGSRSVVAARRTTSHRASSRRSTAMTRCSRSIERSLRQLVPQLGDARITHRWGGPLGRPPRLARQRGVRPRQRARPRRRVRGRRRRRRRTWPDGPCCDLVLGRDTELDPPVVGRPPEPAMGARAAPMARRELGGRRGGPRRRPASRGPGGRAHAGIGRCAGSRAQSQ